MVPALGPAAPWTPEGGEEKVAYPSKCPQSWLNVTPGGKSGEWRPNTNPLVFLMSQRWLLRILFMAKGQISIPYIQLKVPQQPSFPLATPLFLKWSWIKQLLSVPVSGFNWCESLTDWWGRSNQYPLEGGWSKRISHPAVWFASPLEL